MADPFEGPRLKVHNARERHLVALAELIADFRQQKIRFRREPSPDSDLFWVFRAEFTEPLPSQIPLIIGDVAHNLRSALDIMMVDVARVRNKGVNGVKFPFAESKEALDKILKDPVLKRLGTDVVTAISGLAPFKGGNIALRGLHDLDVTDKHKLLLPTYVVAWGGINIPNEINDVLMQTIGLDMRAARTPIHAGASLTLRKDQDPRAFFQPLQNGPEPIFAADLPFAGEPVLKTLEDLAQLTHEIVETFARQFGRGNDNPTGSPLSSDPLV